MLAPEVLTIEKRAITIVSAIPVKCFYAVDNFYQSL